MQPMFGIASRYVKAKIKAPLLIFVINRTLFSNSKSTISCAFTVFESARQSLAFSFDIAKDAMPNSRYYYATQNEGIDICFICILNALLFLSIFKTPTNTKLNAIY